MIAQNHLIGTAGWSVDRSLADFPREGSALERYAAVFSAVEVNSSFYRRHRPATWQRWHDAVPDGFGFSVKLPRRITHERALADASDELKVFFDDVAPLRRKLAGLLIQLPPKLAFDREVAVGFFATLSEVSPVPAFLEPRHASWAAPDVSVLLQDHGVGRVYADPQDSALQAAAEASGACYLRLHGRPRSTIRPMSRMRSRATPP